MNTDIHARGFALTTALREAVERQVEDLVRRQSRRIGSLAPCGLSNINGTRGGPDKGCLGSAPPNSSAAAAWSWRPRSTSISTARSSARSPSCGAGLRTALARGRGARRLRGPRPAALLTRPPGLRGGRRATLSGGGAVRRTVFGPAQEGPDFPLPRGSGPL